MMHKQKTDWIEYYTPRRCEICGKSQMSQSLEDYIKMTTQLYSPYLESLGKMSAGWLGMPQALQPTGWPGMSQVEPFRRHPGYQHKHNYDCGCRDEDCYSCDHGDCHCHCCITDADLVVYARVGERRVVPITIDNCRRRERAIRLELSNWRRSGGRESDVNVQATLTPQEFTLTSCEERVVSLLVGTDLVQRNEGAASSDQPRERLEGDVDDCLVLYADLRVEGCDIRPVRIALVLLPRDCGAYEVSCCSACC